MVGKGAMTRRPIVPSERCVVDARELRRGPLPEVPFISAVVAVRDEERNIARVLDAVCRQSYPSASVEILVADGESVDGTREIVAALASRDPRIRLLSNPLRRVAGGLNVGLRAAQGDVIVRVDGHCVIPPDYFITCVKMLREGQADCVGGPVRAEGETTMGRAIAQAMSTPFGVGGAAFRWATTVRDVDSLPFGAYRREVFEVVGEFDEALVRNQDDDFSDRLRRRGGRIVMDPAIPVRYFSRASLAGLWRQYFGYGFWKVRVIRKRGGWPSSPRHLVPAVFVCATLGSILAAGAMSLWFLPGLVMGPYTLFLLAATGHSVASLRDRAAALVPCALIVMHVAYGVGFIFALALAVAPTRSSDAVTGRRST